MQNSITHKTIWNDAAKSGLVLGLVTVILMIPANYVGNIPAKVLAGVLNFALWLAKFIICIAVMKRYMVRFAQEHEGSQTSHILRYGMAMAVASALITAAFKFLDVAYINQDLYSQAIETAIQSYSRFMSSSDLDSIRESMNDLPVLIFFWMFIYCTIYGIIVASILSRSIPEDFSIFDEPDDEVISETTDKIDENN